MRWETVTARGDQIIERRRVKIEYVETTVTETKADSADRKRVTDRRFLTGNGAVLAGGTESRHVERDARIC